MKITVLASTYPRFEGDGAAPFVRSICEALTSLRHQVEVVAPFDPAVRSFEMPSPVRVHWFRYAPVKAWHIMGYGRALQGDMHFRLGVFFLLPFFLLIQFFTTLFVAYRQRAEIIHVHWVLPNGVVGLIVAALLRRPLVISLHGSDVFVARRYVLLGWVARLIFRRAMVVTACSPELRAGALALGASEDKVHLIPWGVDPERFRPDSAPLDRAALGLEKDVPVLVVLGRLVPKKGFDVAVRALAELVTQYPQVQLVIGGEGPERERLSQLAESLGIAAQVHFAGQIRWEQTPGFLALADIFLLPSVYDASGNVDGLPTVLLEALGVGKPVVASRIAGIPLVVTDGVNGVLCEPGDVQDLAQKIRALLTDDAQRAALGRSGRQSVEERYNWLAVARQLSTLMAAGRQLSSRLGSDYRQLSFAEARLSFNAARILDVGCYDGAWLQTVGGALRVGVDLEPGSPAPGVWMVQADAQRLPFHTESFDQVVAADVIEHLPDATAIVAELARVTCAGGKLFVTTPSLTLRMFPPFLTGWISRRWGHYWRQGYTRVELEALFSPWCQVEITSWNAPAYRMTYLGLRLVYDISTQVSRKMLRCVARWDARHRTGERGFYWLEGRKSG